MRQVLQIRKEYDAGGRTVAELAADYEVSRPTIYRALGGPMREAEGKAPTK